jgi:hypothetical protein
VVYPVVKDIKREKAGFRIGQDAFSLSPSKTGGRRSDDRMKIAVSIVASAAEMLG